jgi:hypothetical protein
MKTYSLLLKIIIGCFFLLCIIGCEEEKSFLIESQFDLMNRHGIYHVILNDGINKALDKLNLGKYSGKKVEYDVKEFTDGYTENITDALIQMRLEESGVKIVIEESSKDTTKGEKEPKEEYDYKLDFYIPICGIYRYNGFFKENYKACLKIKLVEIQKDAKSNLFESDLIETSFNRFIPSLIFTISIWALVVGTILIVISKFIHKKNTMHNK